MTFRDIALKNFKAHARRYLSFFLCSSFTIMVFFMFSSIYFNKSINGTLKSSTKDIFNATLISILLFSFLFLGYAYTSFSKSRKREFGLFLILGMSNRAIRKMLLIENALIASASLAAGLVAGTVFSRLFFMIVVKLLNLEGIAFQFFSSGYIATILLFLAEFLIIAAIGSIIAGRAEIIESFKASRTVDRDWFKNPLFGIAGLFLFVLSFVLKYMDTVDMIHVREMSMKFVILCFTGLFFTISQFGNVLAFLYERKESLYYENLPGISGIRHKIFRSKTVLFLIAMLSAISVYFIGTAISTLLRAADTAEAEQPWHLAYVEKPGTGVIPEQELQGILNAGDRKPSVQKKVEFVEARMKSVSVEAEEEDNESGAAEKESTSGYDFAVTVLSDKSFSELDKTGLAVEAGQCVMLYPDDMLQSEGHRLHIEVCSLTAGSGTYRYQPREEGRRLLLNKIQYVNRVIFVLNDADYTKLKKTAGTSRIGYLRLVNYPDWRRTSEISRALENRLTSSSTLSDIERYQYGEFPLLGSRIGTYEKIRSEGSLLLFLTTFLGGLFFLSSASVISFKLFSEIEEEREKYRKFFTIGIRKKEVRRYLSGELCILFFLPPVVGVLMAFLYTLIDLKYSPYRLDNLADLSLVTVGYLLFQTVFYNVVKNKYADDIDGHFNHFAEMS